MTVHIVSAGRSLFEWMKAPTRVDETVARAIDKTRPHELLAHCDQGTDPGPGPAASAQLATWFRTGPPTPLHDCLDRVTPSLWPYQASAELATQHRVTGDRTLDRRDIAVLLATDTPAGQLAAVWNALALAAGDPARVHYRADPGQPLGDVRGGAVVVRVPDLDARNDEGFVRAMRGLGTLGRALLPRAARTGGETVTEDGEAINVMLSGGYKATIPYLIGLAEGLRSMPGVGPVRAWVLHEDTQTDAIPLPLRRMTKSLVWAAVEHYTGRERRTAPPDLLEGYAFEKHGDRWRLTAFGEGLRALFGVPDEAVGGR